MSHEVAYVRSPAAVTSASSGTVVLVDVDGDGLRDIVTQHLLQRRVDVRFATSAGAFAGGRSRATRLPFEPGDLAVADVDGDGFPDLVVASHDRAGRKEYVNVLLGDGTGTFVAAPTPRYATQASARGYKPALVVADVDRDGSLDVLAGNGRRPAIDVLLGDGRGGFRRGGVVRMGEGAEYYTFGVGNVDGDELVDLVVSGSGRVGYLPGLGDGTFASERRLTGGLRARLLDVSDLTGDGRADLILAHDGLPRLSVLINQGDGRFASAGGSPYALADETYDVAVTDANLDGHHDIVAATTRSVTLLLGRGAAFAPSPGSPFPVRPGAYRVAVALLDADQVPDVVASSFEGPSATLLRGRLG